MPFLCHEWMSLLVGKKFKKTEGLFGIEIETETTSDKDYPKGFLEATTPEPSHMVYKTPLKNWKAITDGSLRNFGVEYVLNGPQTFLETRASLDEFKEYLGKVSFLKDSPSTSVHIHINMLNMTMTQIVNFVMLYSFFENLLIEFSGPTRRSNLFALPLKNCDKSLSGFIRAVIAFNAGACDSFPTDDQAWKYSALNFCPLLRHGSFEIRSFRGTTDIELIWTWINILKKLYDAALVGNPRTLMSDMRDYRSDLLEVVFEEYSSALRHPDYKEMIQKNIIYPVLISDCVKDWDHFEDEVSHLCEQQKRVKPEEVRPWQSVAPALAPGYLASFTSVPDEEYNQWVITVLKELIKEPRNV